MDQMVLKSQFLKKLTKFVVVSIWVFSIFLSHKSYFSRFTIRLVTHTIDKSYMFLFCNGLLVFVAKYSGLISSEPREEETSVNVDKPFDCRDFESYGNVATEFEQVQRQQTEPFLAEEVTETRHDSETVSDNVEELGKDIHVVQEDQNRGNEEEEEEEEEEVMCDQEDDCDCNEGYEEESIINGVMVTSEELNKKFDEFIRKMKEELRIEARRQLLILV